MRQVVRDRVLRGRKGGTHQRDVGEKTKEITRAKERKEKEKGTASVGIADKWGTHRGSVPCPGSCTEESMHLAQR